MNPYEGFDRYCDEWEAAHPGAQVDMPAMFAQWLANATQTTIIGAPAGEAPALIAIPEETT